MLYKTELSLSLDNEKLVEKFVGENLHLNSNDQIVIWQRGPITVECESLLTSIDKRENNQHSVFTIRNAEMEQSEKCSDDIVALNINGRIQNNSKEGKAYVCSKNTHEILKKASKSTEKSKKTKRPKEKKRVFSLLDILISVSIVGPFAIGFWRGVWTWMDLHAELFPDWLCFMFGSALHVAFAFFKNQFHEIYMNKWTKLGRQKRMFYRVLRILYTYTFGVACIAHWRGGWIIFDDLFLHIWITIAVTFLLVACLAVLRCIRNLIATPLIIFIDRPSYFFQFPTRYNVVSLKS